MNSYKIFDDIVVAAKPLAPLGGVLLTVYALYWVALGIYRGVYLLCRLLVSSNFGNHSISISYRAVPRTKTSCLHYKLPGALRYCTEWSILQACEQAS